MPLLPIKFILLKTLVLLLVLNSKNTVAQETTKTDAVFYILADNLIALKPTNYQTIDSTLFGFKNDTLKIKYIIEKSAANNYKEGECYALNSLGIVYRNISNYNRAMTLHTQALELAKGLENKELEVLSLNMLGVVYRRMDAIRSALDYHKQALDLAEAQKEQTLELKRGIAVSFNSMGKI